MLGLGPTRNEYLARGVCDTITLVRQARNADAARDSALKIISRVRNEVHNERLAKAIEKELIKCHNDIPWEFTTRHIEPQMRTAVR